MSSDACHSPLEDFACISSATALARHRSRGICPTRRSEVGDQWSNRCARPHEVAIGPPRVGRVHARSWNAHTGSEGSNDLRARRARQRCIRYTSGTFGRVLLAPQCSRACCRRDRTDDDCTRTRAGRPGVMPGPWGVVTAPSNRRLRVRIPFGVRRVGVETAGLDGEARSARLGAGEDETCGRWSSRSRWWWSARS
jgi:hypothetical protein